MTTFSERQKGFEKKFEHDQELAFKAKVRRNRLLGLWAAERMGLEGAAGVAYAKEVVAAEFDEGGDDGVIRKVVQDLAAKGVAIDNERVAFELKRCATEARKQIMADRR